MNKIKLAKRNTNIKYMPFLEKLRSIYDQINLEYRKISEYYEFNCNGCIDSCCSTIFYHHTILEFIYVIHGFNSISSDKQNKLEEQVLSMNKKTIPYHNSSYICPFKEKNICIIYKYRPMVCRLHGIPNKLYYPNLEKKIIGPGCHRFEALILKKSISKRLNRTPFYTSIASLELEIRKAIKFNKRLKLTIAEMIINRHIIK